MPVNFLTTSRPFYHLVKKVFHKGRREGFAEESSFSKDKVDSRTLFGLVIASPLFLPPSGNLFCVPHISISDSRCYFRRITLRRQTDLAKVTSGEERLEGLMRGSKEHGVEDIFNASR